MERIRVLLANSHQVVREGLRAMLDTADDIEVVGEATNGLEALAAAAQCNPHVVLMNLDMPAMDGLEATRRFKQEFSDVSVVILTGQAADSYALEAIRAGATGFLLQDTSRSLLANAIRAVHSGGALFDTSIVQEAMRGPYDLRTGSATSGMGLAGDAGKETAVGRLTTREREVLAMIVEGRTNKEIAAALYMSRDTVKKRVQSILVKLGAVDRTDAAVKATRAGLFL